MKAKIKTKAKGSVKNPKSTKPLTIEVPAAGTTKVRREFRDARNAMREAKDLPQFFAALFTMLTTPQDKVYKVSKFDGKTGKPSDGKFVTRKDSDVLYFHFDDESLSRIPLKDDVIAFLTRTVKKRGMTVLTIEALDNSQLSLEYKSVVVWADHHSTNYAIKITATAVNNSITL